mmetsp:Transcript_12836/g.30515  ORF Transcript_12836/g.30515 Transcript_12836/m.30515 type:complete len:318 (+) Transcript_12836:281-1234(+)
MNDLNMPGAFRTRVNIARRCGEVVHAGVGRHTSNLIHPPQATAIAQCPSHLQPLDASLQPRRLPACSQLHGPFVSLHRLCLLPLEGVDVAHLRQGIRFERRRLVRRNPEVLQRQSSAPGIHLILRLSSLIRLIRLSLLRLREAKTTKGPATEQQQRRAVLSQLQRLRQQADGLPHVLHGVLWPEGALCQQPQGIRLQPRPLQHLLRNAGKTQALQQGDDLLEGVQAVEGLASADCASCAGCAGCAGGGVGADAEAGVAQAEASALCAGLQDRPGRPISELPVQNHPWQFQLLQLSGEEPRLDHALLPSQGLHSGLHH